MQCPRCGSENREISKYCSKCGSALSVNKSLDSIISGTVLAGRYKIIRLIKSGGMGAVYEAIDEHFGDKCALKEMSPHFSSSKKIDYLTKRFEEEAKMLRKLHHNNLPRVIDYFTDGRKYYLIMDFIEGADLETISNEKGDRRISEEVLRDWAKQLLDVLSYLHSQNPPIIYRDLKPANIMLGKSDGKLFLIDFGIARTVTESEASHTVIGTQGYAPPEQYKGHAEPRSDLYALGATLHHLITGNSPLIPFHFDPVRKLNPHASENFEKVIMKALSSNLEDRFASAEEMKRALILGLIPQPIVVVEKESEEVKDAKPKGIASFLKNLLQKKSTEMKEKETSPPVSIQEQQQEMNNVVLPASVEKFEIPDIAPISPFQKPEKHNIIQPAPDQKPETRNSSPSIVVKNIDLVNMIMIPTGHSLMGSKETAGFLGSKWQVNPVYRLYVESYYIDKYPVTYEDYEKFLMVTGYKSEGNWNKYYIPSDYLTSAGKHPVINITWNDANAYARWKNKRLPTQAEWEYAARGTDFRNYPWGQEWDRNKCNNLRMDRKDLILQMLNIDNGRGTLPVDLFLDGASPYGVMDMAGNVWEWCHDWHHKLEGSQVNPQGPSSGTFKILCGGAWNLQDMYCFWCATRTKEKPDGYGSQIGFRCAKSI